MLAARFCSCSKLYLRAHTHISGGQEIDCFKCNIQTLGWVDNCCTSCWKQTPFVDNFQPIQLIQSERQAIQNRDVLKPNCACATSTSASWTASLDLGVGPDTVPAEITGPRLEPSHDSLICGSLARTGGLDRLYAAADPQMWRRLD